MSQRKKYYMVAQKKFLVLYKSTVSPGVQFIIELLLTLTQDMKTTFSRTLPKL